MVIDQLPPKKRIKVHLTDKIVKKMAKIFTFQALLVSQNFFSLN